MQRSGMQLVSSRLGTDAASQLFYLWFLLHLTHTSKVVLLLFIHREIVHP